LSEQCLQLRTGSEAFSLLIGSIRTLLRCPGTELHRNTLDAKRERSRAPALGHWQ
jgi:hypothetical protein